MVRKLSGLEVKAHPVASSPSWWHWKSSQIKKCDYRFLISLEKKKEKTSDESSFLSVNVRNGKRWTFFWWWRSKVLSNWIAEEPNFSQTPKKDNNKEQKNGIQGTHTHIQKWVVREKTIDFDGENQTSSPVGPTGSRIPINGSPHRKKKAINRIDYIYVDWVFSIGHFHCRISPRRNNRSVNYLCGATFQSSVLPRPKEVVGLVDRSPPYLMATIPLTRSPQRRNISSPCRTRVLIWCNH